MFDVMGASAAHAVVHGPFGMFVLPQQVTPQQRMSLIGLGASTTTAPFLRGPNSLPVLIASPPVLGFALRAP